LKDPTGFTGLELVADLPLAAARLGVAVAWFVTTWPLTV